MPQIEPKYLIPVVNWFMWYLTGKRGKPARLHTPDEIFALALQNKKFAGISPAQMRAALDRALLNVAATERAQALADSCTGTFANQPEQ